MVLLQLVLALLALCYNAPLIHCFLVKSTLHTTKPSPKFRTTLQAQQQPEDADHQYYWQSHVSTHPDGFNAFKQIWNDVTHKKQMDLAFLFIGQAHASDFEEIVQHAKLQLSGGTGSSNPIRLVTLLGGGVIGENVELDEMERPSMSLLIGGLPKGAQVDIVEYTNREGKENNNNLLEFDDDQFTSCLVFADPWAPVERMISSSSVSVTAGGITCPFLADQASLAIDNRCLPQGSMIGVAFGGTLGLQTMVAQGCRPVGGSIFRVTACDGNVITKLDDKPALQVLQDVANRAPPKEQQQIESGLLCGISSSNAKDDEPPDFLSRQIMGFAPAIGGIAIGTNHFAVGDLFCFQVRDGTTAQQDLQLLVQRAKTARLFAASSSAADDENKRSRPLAALQISCVARGRGMFDGIPNVDLSQVKQLGGDSPVVGGFFANGEIGPVGLAGFESNTFDGRSYLHSFTTVAAILCEYTSSGSSNSPQQDAASSDGIVQESSSSSSSDAWG